MSVKPSESSVAVPSAEGGAARNATADSADTARVHHREGVPRQFFESMVCLAVAVIFFRAFILEGYIISTGSMAPHLLGYHKRVACPDCGFKFEFGTAFDRAVPVSQIARCPNCGEDRIDATKIPRNDGDQLLVFKYAYLNRDPARWEVVVFLNPNNPTQAYVKRLVGRPGETIEILDGDVFIDGRLSRKAISIQRATRIAVFDHTHPARRRGWIPRWLTAGDWSYRENGFMLGKKSSPSQGYPAVSSRTLFSPLRTLAASELPPASDSAVAEPVSQHTDEWNWCHYLHRSSGADRQSAAAVRRSGGDISPDPIRDRYGYNRVSGSRRESRVHDLMWTGRVRLGTTGQFAVVLHNRDRWGVCVLDMDRARLDAWVVPGDQLDRPFHDPAPEPQASVPLRGEWMTPEIDLEVSGFDYQLCVAINGQSLIEQPFETAGSVPGRKRPVSSLSHALAGSRRGTGSVSGTDLSAANVLAAGSTGAIQQTAAVRIRKNTDAPASRIRFGGRNGTFFVSHLNLFRDVHYTSAQGGNGIGKPYRLGDDQFFFLGDNSPVSLDSRGWQNPVVPRHLIVGKPVIVHLPSRPGRIRVGQREWFFRVPDVSRIRYIR